MTSRLTRRGLGLGGSAAVLAVLAFATAGAGAQQDLPSVTLTSSGPGKVTLMGADALQSGPTAITLKGTGKEADMVLFELKPGVTVAQASAAVDKITGPPTPFQKYGRFVYENDTRKGGSYTATVTLLSRTYVVIDATHKPKLLTSFTVGDTASGATAPTPDATITLKNYKIEVPAKLPTTGIIRFHNAGMSPHFVVYVPTSSKANAVKAAKLLRQGKEKQAQKLAAGMPGEFVGVISPTVTNDVPVSGLKPGYYVLACFYGDKHSHGKEHSMLGMETVARVG